ncbi:Chorion peroxidase, partial [Fragariocoptes setiger]
PLTPPAPHTPLSGAAGNSVGGYTTDGHAAELAHMGAHSVRMHHHHHHDEHGEHAGNNALDEEHDEEHEHDGHVKRECALILQRTYVKSPHDRRHVKTEQACISYKDIEWAVAMAKRKLRFVSPPANELSASLEPSEQTVAAIGELTMATSQLLADKFDLSNDEILNGLPLIDVRKTSLWPVCPLLVRPIDCGPVVRQRYRTFTGHCNNVRHPAWGAALTPYARYLPPVHPDGIWAPRKSLISVEWGDSGSGGGGDAGDIHLVASAGRALELPLVRRVTAAVHRDVDVPSHDFSILFMSWGQLLDHDMSRAAQPPPQLKCCPQQQQLTDNVNINSNNNLIMSNINLATNSSKLCLPIQVPEDDPFYSQFQVRCLEFRRSLAGVRPNCVLGPRAHINALTANIDANFVYGSSKSIADSLRSFHKGQLKARDWFGAQRLKPLLPAQLEQPDLDCLGRPAHLHCFRAGDVRVNEQTHLTVLHTLYMREHNRMCATLATINPHWTDERLYHEVRHIMGATVQHTMLAEYVPQLLGAQLMRVYNLTLASHDQYWSGYEPSVTTSVGDAFAVAAFRQGHTFIQGTVERWSQRHEFVGATRTRHLLKRPFLLYEPGVLDQLTLGMLNQAAQSNDPFIVADVSGHLFQPPRQPFGHDLPAINLQRGREHAIPGYNVWREWCGLGRAHTFADLEPLLSNKTAYLYSRLYRHVDDIDLWTAGVSERHLPGAAIGPTFACIIARQFANTRRGDRHWYELPPSIAGPSAFTRAQLREIRKSNLARLLCANSDHMPTVQRYALRLPHPVFNPRVPCNTLPDIDLNAWRDN